MDQDATQILLAGLTKTLQAPQLASLSKEDWHRVNNLAERQGVAPLLFHRLQQMKVMLPNEVTETLKQKYLQNMARNMSLYQALGQLLRRLQENEIPVIVLKGAYLAEAVYQNIAVRMMGDIDLLVKETDLLRVEKVLLTLGYLPKEFSRVISEDSHDFCYSLPNTAVLLEIHWTIYDSDFPFNVEMESLWDRAQPVTLAQASGLALAPEDLFLYLCLHIAKHTFELGLRMLCDIVELVRHTKPELNWNKIEARAREWDAIRTIYLVLRLTEELFGKIAPEDWLAAIRPESFRETYLDLAREQILGDRRSMNHTELGSLNLLQLFWGKKLGRKLALIRERLLPARALLARQYPVAVDSWKIYLYYPVRLKDVLGRQGAAFWRRLRGGSKMQASVTHINQLVTLRNWLNSG